MAVPLSSRSVSRSAASVIGSGGFTQSLSVLDSPRFKSACKEAVSVTRPHTRNPFPPGETAWRGCHAF